MLIWSGWGFMVVVIWFVCFALTQWTVELVMRDPRYFAAHRWPMALALALSAVGVIFLSRLLDRRKRKILIDPETGEEHVLGSDDSLFFAPVWSWPWILVILAGCFLVAEFVK